MSSGSAAGALVGAAIAYGAIIPLEVAFAMLRRIPITTCPQCGSYVPRFRVTRAVPKPRPAHLLRTDLALVVLCLVMAITGELGVTLIAGVYDGSPHPVLGGLILAAAVAAILALAYIGSGRMSFPIKSCRCGYRARLRGDGSVRPPGGQGHKARRPRRHRPQTTVDP
jgi:hypothetical protein